MKLIKFSKDNHAVVGVVTVVLIIGLIISVFSIIELSFVPEWVKKEEAKHMELVATQFGQLKGILDFQSNLDHLTIFTNYVTLGRNEIPMLEPYRSPSSLKILSNQTKMKIEDYNGFIYEYSSGGIQFSSQHSNFVDQTYIIEAGALIMAQSGSNGFKGLPQIVIESYDENISINFINLTSLSSRNYIAGLGTYPVLSKVISINDYVTYENVTNITLFTNYPRAWYYIFNDSFRNKLVVYEPGLKGYEIFENIDNVQIKFHDPNNQYYTLSVREVKISVEIAWGLLG